MHIVLHSSENQTLIMNLLPNPNFPSSSSTCHETLIQAPPPQTTTMDPQIWCRLPSPLFDRILLFLPPPDFFRVRILSRRIHSLLFSTSFLHSHLFISPPLHFFAFFFSSPFSLFLLDPISLSWNSLPLSSLLPANPNFSPIASSSGLLCFISLAPGPKSLLLINPLSKLTAYLPQTLTPRLSPAIGLSVGPSSLSVIIAGDDLISPFSVKNLSAELFLADATTGIFAPWTLSSNLPRLCSLEPNRMVFNNNKFYCMSVSPFAVLIFDQESNSWSKIQPPMRRFLKYPSLVELGNNAGGIGLVAMVEKNRLNVPRSIRVWALQHSGPTWTEIARMPVDTQTRFSQYCEPQGAFECAGHGGIVAFISKQNSSVLLLDINKKEWKWAPPCPYIANQRIHGYNDGLKVFAYMPRLATPSIGLLTMSS